MKFLISFSNIEIIINRKRKKKRKFYNNEFVDQAVGLIDIK